MSPQPHLEERWGLHPREVMRGAHITPPSLGQVVFDPLPALGGGRGVPEPLVQGGAPQIPPSAGVEPPRPPLHKVKALE